MERYILYNDECGVLLAVEESQDGCIISTWSNINSNGLDVAMTFDAVEDAWKFLSIWDVDMVIQVVPVESENPDFATLEEVMTAGVEGWYPPFHDCKSRYIN